MIIEIIGISDVGRKRTQNEDRYICDSKLGLAVVADGMGGHSEGARAAEITIAAVQGFVACALEGRQFSWPFGYDLQLPFEHNVVRTALRLANMRVGQESKQCSGFRGMGATVVAVWIRNGKAVYSHAGDSRLYLFRHQELSQLTEDHSFVQEQLRKGLISEDEMETHTLKHIVTKAIGTLEVLDVDVHEIDVKQNDVFLLCSDGLSDRVKPGDIAETLDRNPDLQVAAKELVVLANSQGGDDNITAILIRIS